MHTTAHQPCRLLIGFASLALGACATLPAPYAELQWVDLWGERGSGVLARDYVMCSELVEQRRGLLAGCMAARGWSVQ